MTLSNTDWPRDAIIYHLFPLGALGAPAVNAPDAGADRVPALYHWTDHVLGMGADTLLLGPVLHSGSHGYDTTDLFRIDPRIGDTAAFAEWCHDAHRRGLKLVFDGVFHHVGRDFWAFRDVLEHGAASTYRDWFFLDFSRRSGRGDAFAYEGWNGHDDLVKLNTSNEEVRRHLFDAVRFWIETFGIDGLRIDAADVLDRGFQKALAAQCRALKPGFWLLGEVIHGDYRNWVGPGRLDSATNYELHKGLYSSHNDANYFEIAYSLNRQFGENGMYHGLDLNTFADNHDVARIASRLRDARHLYPLHILLFTVPGIPALYYGSEYGVAGEKAATTDAPLRPPLDPRFHAAWGRHPALFPVIRHLIDLRRQLGVLVTGTYRPLHVGHRQFAFLREDGVARAIVAVNAADRPETIEFALPGPDRAYADQLNPGNGTAAHNGWMRLTLDPNWGRVLV